MLSWVLYLAGAALGRVLPPRVSYGISVGLARCVFALRPPARRTLEQNLRRLIGPCAPSELDATARAAFENFALSLTDFLRMGRADCPGLGEIVEIRGAEHLEAARRSGRGVILLSVHLGSWELGAAWLAAGGVPVHLVARPHPSALVERFYARRRGACGVSLLESRPLWPSATAALRRREWIALMVDRTPGGQDGAAHPSVCAWAAALARRTGALVLPGVIVRLPGRRYAACFDEPREAHDAQSSGTLQLLRDQVREHPGQWAAFEPLPEGWA